MTERGRCPLNIRPTHRHERCAGFGQLKLQALGETQFFHKIIMGHIRHAQRQLHRSDIRRMDDNFARGERALFAMHIIDGRCTNFQRRARIKGFVKPDFSAFQAMAAVITLKIDPNSYTPMVMALKWRDRGSPTGG